MRALVATFALTVALGSIARADDTIARTIDAAKSKATFGVQHIYVTHVNGTVPIIGGTVTLPPNETQPVAVTAELDPSKISSGDPDRDGALTSPDFFNVKAFPTWTFTSTKITPVDATAFGVDGTLTLHGVTVPEHLDVTIKGDATHPVYHAVGHIDRQAFHMSVTRLDPVIGKIVDVTLDIVLK
jgi:polyisoprenoid-binding protein YceI